MTQFPTVDLTAFRTACKTEGRLLGVDLGTKTIGLAISDALRTIASPLETLRRSRFASDRDALQLRIEQHAIAGIVVGLPLNMDASVGPRAQSTRAFAINLARTFMVPIALWDERLSTAAVERSMLEGDLSRAKRTAMVDKLAATYILQGAIDRMRQLP